MMGKMGCAKVPAARREMRNKNDRGGFLSGDGVEQKIERIHYPLHATSFFFIFQHLPKTPQFLALQPRISSPSLTCTHSVPSIHPSRLIRNSARKETHILIFASLVLPL